MVQVREAYPLLNDGGIDIAAWVDRLPIEADAKARQELIDAATLSCRAAENDSPGKHGWYKTSSFLTGLEMAQILAELKLDQESLIAAIIYRAVREERLSLAEVTTQFGSHVADLIEGVLRMAAIAPAAESARTELLGNQQPQQDNVRKMLVAMVDDVRVALIKLAERTCAIRAVKDLPERRTRVAQEVFEVYAPLAHRLGIGHIKWELEDLSFRYLQPEAYKRIASLLDERRIDRQNYIAKVLALLNEELAAANIDAEVTGRAKHIYSIWRKMQRKSIGFSQVYDIRAVRILVPDIKDCYTVLGIVHTLWRNIPKEFDDYIATPKENGYRSLHTAVIGPESQVLEVQIRTHKMHDEAELGVCAHWLYKGTDRSSKGGYDDKIAWLRKVLDWHEVSGDMDGLAEQLAADVHDDQIYVFTRDGHVLELARSATPLDFAYHIHTEVGHSCRGAKVNGRIVPLSYHLQTGDQVEIITSKSSVPSREWLRPSLSYLNTSSARAKVRHWFRAQDREHNIATGSLLLDKEFKRLAITLTGPDYKAVADRLNFNNVDELFVAVGAGDIGTGQVINAAQSLLDPNYAKSRQSHAAPRHASKQADSSEIMIQGVGNLLTSIAKCCKPLPGDLVAGYITQGRGVSIHAQDCHKLLQLQQDEPERILQVSWGRAPEATYPVDIAIEAYDRYGLLSDITGLLANERINLIAVNTLSNKEMNKADMRLTLEVSSLESLSRILSKISTLPNIINVRRLREGGD